MRIAAVDIETTDLKANMGIILCCSFKPIIPPEYGPTKAYTLKLENRQPYDPNPDRNLVVAIRDEILKYNCIVTWNGKMFDAPMINSRLMYHGEKPPRIQFHIDAMYYAGGISNRIGSRRLASVQQFLHLPTEKTPLDWDVWKRAGLGDGQALAQVVEHCEADVEVLEEAYWNLLPYMRNIHA